MKIHLDLIKKHNSCTKFEDGEDEDKASHKLDPSRRG